LSLIRSSRAGEISTVETHAALSILNALIGGGVRIRHDCGGKAICGTCRVRVAAGDAVSLSPMKEQEKARLAAIGAGPDERLACRTYAYKDVTIMIDKDH
jgi:ferredoxin